MDGRLLDFLFFRGEKGVEETNSWVCEQMLQTKETICTCTRDMNRGPFDPCDASVVLATRFFHACAELLLVSFIKIYYD